jgi:hypothetical protein
MKGCRNHNDLLTSKLLGKVFSVINVAYKEMSHNNKDRLGLASNSSFVKMLAKKGTEDEVVLMSVKVNKVNRHQKVQLRVCAVTNRALYNLNPSELGKCKRRIALDDITEILIATKGDDVLFHVPSDHDYHVKSVSFLSLCMSI